jgi:hypothetical protein
MVTMPRSKMLVPYAESLVSVTTTLSSHSAVESSEGVTVIVALLEVDRMVTLPDSVE